MSIVTVPVPTADLIVSWPEGGTSISFPGMATHGAYAPLLLTPIRRMVTPIVGCVVHEPAAVKAAAAEAVARGVGVMATGVAPPVERDTRISFAAEVVPCPDTRISQTFKALVAGAVMVIESFVVERAVPTLFTEYRAPMIYSLWI
jgi:hypothetical protein